MITSSLESITSPLTTNGSNNRQNPLSNIYNKNFGLRNIAEVEQNGLYALNDYKAAQQGRISFFATTVCNTFKQIIHFKITQGILDTVEIGLGRFRKKPFIAKMDETIERLMNVLLTSKSYNGILSFEVMSYITNMDKLVLKDLWLPSEPCTDLNKILIGLASKKIPVNDIEKKISELLNKHKEMLLDVPLASQIIQDMELGKAILTPKIILVMFIIKLQQKKVVDVRLISELSEYVVKTVTYYNKRSAMALYVSSLKHENLTKAFLAESKSTLSIARQIINIPADILMQSIPYIYMFVVTNLLIDRDVSGTYLTDAFENYLLTNHTSLNANTTQAIVNVASNFFSKTVVDDIMLKAGNILPTALALSLYFFSTTRLCFNMLFPKKNTTSIHNAMDVLLSSYQKQIQVNQQIHQKIDHTTLDITDKILVPDTNNDRPDYVEASEQSSSSLMNSTEQIKISELKITLNSGESITYAEAVADCKKHNIKPSVLILTLFEVLEGSIENKIERAFQIFTNTLTGVRAIYNVLLELKDATPDSRLMNLIYNHFIIKFVIPINTIESKGFTAELATQCEKDRINQYLSKVILGEVLTDAEEDFILGVIESAGKIFYQPKSKYGIAKIFNSFFTKIVFFAHLSLLLSDIISSFYGDENADGYKDSWFDHTLKYLQLTYFYDAIYLPVGMLINMATFSLQHGIQASKYYWYAMLNFLGRNIVTLPCIPMWKEGTTSADTQATLLDSAGTTGHDESSNNNVIKARLMEDINKAETLLTISSKTPNLWKTALNINTDSTNQDTELNDKVMTEDDFASFMSYRFQMVIYDLLVFSQKKPIKEMNNHRKEKTNIDSQV